MPVVVTGADGPLGRAVVAALAGADRDVRATVDDRTAVAPLVARGVKTAVSDLVDTERFGAVVEGAHTVVHLRGGGGGEVLRGLPDVLAALPESGVRRIVTIAGLGASDPALDALHDSGYDAVVLRVGAVLAPAGRPPSWRPRSRRLAPLYVDDLVEAVVAADRLRELPGYVEVDAVGVDVVTAGELDRLLGVRRGPGYPRLRGSADLVGDAGDGLRRMLGVVPRPVDAAVRAVRAGG